MADWMQDPDVRQAAQAYELARSEWLQATTASLGTDRRSRVQDEAFFRMKAADRAYVWVRDRALDRVTGAENILERLAAAS